MQNIQGTRELTPLEKLRYISVAFIGAFFSCLTGLDRQIVPPIRMLDLLSTQYWDDIKNAVDRMVSLVEWESLVGLDSLFDAIPYESPKLANFSYFLDKGPNGKLRFSRKLEYYDFLKMWENYLTYFGSPPRDRFTADQELTLLGSISKTNAFRKRDETLLVIRNSVKAFGCCVRLRAQLNLGTLISFSKGKLHFTRQDKKTTKKPKYMQSFGIIDVNPTDLTIKVDARGETGDFIWNGSHFIGNIWPFAIDPHFLQDRFSVPSLYLLCGENVWPNWDEIYRTYGGDVPSNVGLPVCIARYGGTFDSIQRAISLSNY